MKNSIYILLIVLITSGCSVEKRLSRLLVKHPLPTTIEYLPGEVRDSIIEIEVPGETVIGFIKVPADVPDTSITKETTFAVATATFEDNTLSLELIQKDTVVPVPVVIPATPDTVRITNTPPPIIKEVKVKSKSLPYWISAAIVEFLLLIIFIFLLIKLKR